MEDEETWEIPMTMVTIKLPEAKAEALIEIMKMYCSSLIQITQTE